MPTQDKARVIEQTQEWYSKSSGVVSVDYRGLKVKELQALRADLRAKGAELHIVKNTLFRRAVGDHAQNLFPEFDNGTTAYAFVFSNEGDVANALLEYARTSKKLVVKGGLFGGQAYDVKGVERVSKLPSKEVLLSQVIGVIAAPLANLAGTVEAIYAEPIRTVYAVADRDGEAAPAAEASSEAPETVEAPAETETPEVAPEAPSDSAETPEAPSAE